MATIHIQPDWRALLEAAGLESFDALFAAGEQNIVDGHRQRTVSRLRIPATGGRTVVLYLKRRWGRAARRQWADLARLRLPARAVRQEWANLRKLSDAGIPVADPVAWGEDRGPDGPRALLAVREVPGVSLARWLASLDAPGGPSPSYDVASVARAVGRAVRRLHDAGYSFPDLYAKHLFLEDAGADGPRVVLIDPARLRRITPGRAAADLAALQATIDAPSLTHEDRLLVLRAYLGEDAPETTRERLARRVKRRARRIAGRGRDPHLLPERRSAPPGMIPLAEEKFTVLDGGRLRVNEAFRPALEAAGLATLDALMTFPGGEAYRTVPGRRTVRFEIPRPPTGAGGGGAVALYLKRHDRVPWRTRLRRTISLGDPISLAEQEARNIVRLADEGIATMRCVAVGWELASGGRQERSCLVTEEIAGGREADRWAESVFAPPRSRQAAAKRRFVRALGSLARRFHAAGFAHRDFYLCHVLVRRAADGEPHLHLIDLQRVLRFRRRVPRRWIVKDLAALLFSSWPSEATWIRSAVFTDTDRLRFARAYFGVERLGPCEKALLRSAVRKARRIARRVKRRASML